MIFIGKSKGTPGRGNKTPTTAAADRFIPNRGNMQFELGHHLLKNRSGSEDEDVSMMSPSKREYQRVMEENLNGDAMNSKIIAYKAKAPAAPEGKLTETVRMLWYTAYLGNDEMRI